MEKAKIINIRKTKRGNLIGDLLFENNKTLPIPPFIEVKTEWLNKECKVRREKGQVIQMNVDGKEVIIGAKPQPKLRQQKPVQTEMGMAHAPYNFVPLNEVIVKGEKPLVFNRYYEHQEHGQQRRFTGYIECDLKVITPLYIRDTQNEEEFLNGKEYTKNPDFFSPGNTVRIPGSSLRGMVRTLVEIASFSKFNFFDDKLLYYRGVVDQSSLGQEYAKNMTSLTSGKDKGKVTYNFNAGYLKKQGLRYFIIPAQVIGGQQIKKIKREQGSNKKYCFEKNKKGAYRVISGPMPNKKHDWLINPPDYNQKPIEIPDIDILSYQNDTNRYADKGNDDRNKQDGDLLRMVRVYHDQLIPCFYVKWIDLQGRDRISFGHTGYFRLAYKKTIGDHIPPELKETETLDITETIFGKLGEFAGRVFFEDAVIKPDEKAVFKEKVSPKVLSNPKPTTFQHYLEQEGVRTRSELKHWNSDAKIRGYKLYWHKVLKDWSEGREIEDNVHTVIKPLQPGVHFKFTIRFENLAAYELGALLFVLDLPNGCYHKLGMGKPLGLGTIEISPKLHISDRQKRYTQLFSDATWELALRETETKEFKDAFEKYVLKYVDKGGNLPSLWEHKRLKQLATILNWNNTKQSNWTQKTRYLELGEFRKRLILKSPEKYTQ